VSLLLAAGAPLEARDPVLYGLLVSSDRLQSGRTPLDNACCEGHVGVVSVLLAAGATLEATDEVMYEFVWSGRRECLTVCRMDGLLSTMLVGMGKSNWFQCCWRQVQLLRQEIRYESRMSWSGLVKESV
jgi:hypothetical protein